MWGRKGGGGFDEIHMREVVEVVDLKTRVYLAVLGFYNCVQFVRVMSNLAPLL